MFCHCELFEVVALRLLVTMMNLQRPVFAELCAPDIVLTPQGHDILLAVLF